MSALGQKVTFRRVPVNVSFLPKASSRLGVDVDVPDAEVPSEN
jgi:hypothetical protein